MLRRVHGWPGLRASDLVALGLQIAKGKPSWHSGSPFATPSRTLGVPHPDDPDVILGTEADLLRCRDLGVTAAVSLSRVAAADRRAAGLHPDKRVEVWLVDSEDPAENAHLAWTLADAAEHRTPAVALAYSRLLGVPTEDAAPRIEAALGHRVAGLLWRTALDDNQY